MNVFTKLKDVNLEKWKEFVSSHPLGTIFQHPYFLAVYQETPTTIPIVISVKEGKEITGLMLAIVQREHKGILGKFSSRAIIVGGPLMKTRTPELLDNILKAYNKELKGRAIYTQFRNHWEWSESERKIFENNGYSYENHLDIIHDLSIPIEDQLKMMHSGRRKNIRRAEKMDVVIEMIDDDENFLEAYNLVKETYKRIKLPFPKSSFFFNVKKQLEGKEVLKVFIIKYNNVMIGTRMVLCFNELIYDWYAGSDEKHLDKYPNDYLPWIVMKWGSENNFKTFDFGGAGNANKEYGVRDYKLKFGGTLVEYGRFEKVHKPAFMKLGKLGLKMYQKFK